MIEKRVKFKITWSEDKGKTIKEETAYLLEGWPITARAHKLKKLGFCAIKLYMNDKQL